MARPLIPGRPTEAVVVTQGGMVWRVSLTNAFARTEFGNLTGLIRGGGAGSEEGLLSLAFSPNFVGDSRVYLFREGELQRITIDHSLVEEYLRLGKITAEEAKTFPQKNIILRALGQQKIVDVEVNELAPEAGDVFLLCSDGLSGMVPDDMMQSILQKSNGLDSAVKKLIDTANANGGIDNVTVVLAQYLPS